MLLSLQDANREEALQAVDLRVEAMGLRLMAAKTLSLLGEWHEAEVRASKALEAAMIGWEGDQDEQREQLAQLGLLPEAGAKDPGLLVHRDAADAFLCRARARLRIGDAVGARDDAAKARNLSSQLDDQQKQEAADGFLMQAQMIISATGHDPKLKLGQRSPEEALGRPGDIERALPAQEVSLEVCDIPLTKMPRPDEIRGIVLQDLD
mmetsp:Transcript_32272/g.60771  ORF Transcript_32272/g.60771 Transcript_32272/m.60771 type:complete len:208 (+) Transcript_32272:3-626(+)